MSRLEHLDRSTRRDTSNLVDRHRLQRQVDLAMRERVRLRGAIEIEDRMRRSPFAR